MCCNTQLCRQFSQSKDLHYPLFRYDHDIPMLLDYEIWKSSSMLFQKSPYDEKDEDLEEKMIKEDKSKDAP